MLVDQFFGNVMAHIKTMEETQKGALSEAGKIIADAYKRRSRTFIFGSGHAALTVQEVFTRAGGLALYNPIFIPILHPSEYPYTSAFLMERISGLAEAAIESAPVKEGDVMVVISTSGRNHVPLEMAMEAKKRGMTVIVLTSIAFSDGVPSRHPSGKMLKDVADCILDNGAPLGDACVEIPDFPAKAAPLSGILSATIMHALECAICEHLVSDGIRPPVFMSGNLDISEAHNARIAEENKDIITFLP